MERMVMSTMALSKTACAIRRVAPERAVARFWRWVLLFCIGYATCHIAHDVTAPPPCAGYEAHP